MEITRGDNMAFKKITNSELSSRGATTLPDQPTISATALKEEFDAPAKEIVAPKFNGLIDDLGATSAAANIGAIAPSGSTVSTVQGYLDELDVASHVHLNKEVIDKFSDVSGEVYYDGSPVGGASNAFKTVKVGATNIVASGEDTLELRQGSNVTLTADSTGKYVIISSTGGGGGQSTGDMLASDYDSTYAVKSAGGIPAYITAQNYIATSQTQGLMKNDGTVDTRTFTTTSLPAASGGADLSLVTTGEKYTWNQQSGSIVTISHTGSASASGVRKQILTIDGTTYDVDGTAYMEQTQTLSTTADKDFVFANGAITVNSAIDVYGSIYGISPSNVEVINGQCTVTIPKHDAALSLKIRIYIR